MKVLNIMLSRDLGGIQQSFVDYSLALRSQKIDVVNVTSLFAQINTICNDSIKLPNLGPWDFLSIIYLAIRIFFIKPDVIIVHGARAITFTIMACSKIPIVGVAHNYNVKNLLKCKYIIALTNHMAEYLLEQRFDQKCVQVIPNMVYINKDYVSKNYHHPITIGVAARFVKKKGLDIFLQSLVKLKEQHYDFRVLIGGSGDESKRLVRMSKDLNLDNNVSFIGWIKNQDKFFNDIDIFCLPSLHEPFGIILLKAMAHSVPIVATNTEGPSEILRNKYDGLLCKADSVEDMAAKLAYMLINQTEAKKYTANAYNRANDKYSNVAIAPKLAYFIESIQKGDV